MLDGFSPEAVFDAGLQKVLYVENRCSRWKIMAMRSTARQERQVVRGYT